jgi:SnoaL-like domain
MKPNIEMRLRAIEDERQIANLKARYINACDGGWGRASHDADVVASIFAPAGTWEAEGFPRAEGREAIRKLFQSFGPQAPFAFHCISNPLIEVRGDAASGEWHLSELFTDAQGTETWAGGIYSDTFVRIEDGWLIHSMSVRYAFIGPYQAGLNAARRRQ